MKIRTIAYIGILIVLEIIMTRFVQIPVPVLPFHTDRISLGFLPIALAGAAFGPITGALTAAVADVIRATIFPQGTINLLFTVTAALRGGVYGLFFREKVTFPRVLTVSLLIFVFLNLLLNSYFVHISYGTPFLPFLSMKAVTSSINLVVQILVLGFVLEPLKKNMLRG